MIRYCRAGKALILLLLLAWGNNAFSQTDTLRLNFKETEKLFLQNNFSLLAQKYNIDASKALVQQARLWDNPTLSTDQNISDASHQLFNHSGDNGQIFLQLSQIIKTAGKRGKQIRIAEDGTKIQEAQFTDLLRNLRYNLQLDFAQADNLIQQRRVYEGRINSATNLVNAIDKSYQAGNTSLKDLIRLKALLFGLQNDLVEIDRQLNELQTELKTLIAARANQFVMPQIPFSHADTTLNIEALIALAKTQRGDYLVNQYTLAQNNDYLNLQKAIAKPDVTVGVSYDQHSSYAPHYVGLQIGMPLPFINRNQGNIKSAKLQVESQQYAVKNNELQLQNDIYNAVQQFKLSQQILGKNETDFSDRYDQLFKSMLKGYRQRQISLQEFVDFFDSYTETRVKILQQQYNLQKAIADLNYAVGTTVITTP